MQYVFVDNFRGFTSTLVPLSNVNFFVGENSTGKTSLISLINTLSTSQFWYSSNALLNNQDTPLAPTFEDIVSISANDRTSLSVGWLTFPESLKGDRQNYTAYLITYTEKDGMPMISAFSYLTQQTQIHVRITNRAIIYRSEHSIDLKNRTDEDLKQIFLKLVVLHKRKENEHDYHKLPKKLLPIRFSLAILTSLVLVFDHNQNSENGEVNLDTAIRQLKVEPQPIFQNPVWLAPIRTKPRTTYDEYSLEYSAEGKHTPYLIRKFFQTKKDRERFLTFIEKFGKESNLFETIGTKNYGSKITAPFELSIRLTGRSLKITNVGYGISQVLPVIVEIFSRPASTCFFIQQPEVHLHPKAQVALGTLFSELSIAEKKIFIIETHSDFIIDGFRLKCKEKKLEQTNSQIIFFERSAKGNSLYTIPILPDGILSESQPAGYRDFFMNHEMRVLGY